MDFAGACDSVYVKIAMLGRTRLSHLPIRFPLMNFLSLEILIRKVTGYDISRHLEMSESFLKESVRLECDDIFVDVGAHMGQWSIWAARRAKLVIALEPNRHAFFWLRRFSKSRNIMKLGLAAWSHDGTVEAGMVSGIGSVSSIHDLSSVAQGSGERVGVVRLDTLLSRMNIPTSAVVLKVDVEGAEEHVLAGAHGVLSQAKMVILEVHRLANDNRLDRVIQLLRGFGFEVEVRPGYVFREFHVDWVICKRTQIPRPCGR